MRGEGNDATSQTSRHDLVFALCHEIGNLLAASRLEASLLTTVGESGELAHAAERISEISARAGSLLALLRPLLVPNEIEALATDPVEILGGLRRGLDASCDERVGIDLDSAATLPAAALAGEVIHHLLLTEIFFGLEAAGSEGGARVSARALDGCVVFRVDSGACPDLDQGSGPLRGRPLAHAIAGALLAHQRGRLEVSQGEGRTRVDFALNIATS